MLTLRRFLRALLPLVVLAGAPARAEAPVVSTALFFSPTCPHCHKVMTSVLPPIQARFGAQLRIAYVDASTPQGNARWREVMAQHLVPPDRQGVPMMVVGDQLLIGEDEIPARLPGLVEQLLAAGGSRGPAFLAASAPPAAPAAATAAFPRLPRDPASAAILGLLLAALVVQLGHAAVTWRRRPAAGRGARRWLTPALLLASLGVALYLTRAEVGRSHVVCLSDCDAVHSSEWAWLFGVVPVGALGALGAVLLLGAWLLSRARRPRAAAWGGAALMGLALFGVAFSVYLTFLELFVIGAMCEWCVGNAVLLAIVAALELAPGKRALDLARA